MRIYKPEKVILTEAARVDKSSCLLKLRSTALLLYDLSTMNEHFLLSLLLLITLRTFSQILATVIKLFLYSVLYFEMYINSLNVERKIYS